MIRPETIEALRNLITTRDVWAVVTALRGPDYHIGEGPDEPKAATTEVIRWHLFGDRSDADYGFGSYLGAFMEADTPDKVAVRMAMPPSHFRSHASHAFKALDLMWDAVNPDPWAAPPPTVEGSRR